MSKSMIYYVLMLRIAKRSRANVEILLGFAKGSKLGT